MTALWSRASIACLMCTARLERQVRKMSDITRCGVLDSKPIVHMRQCHGVEFPPEACELTEASLINSTDGLGQQRTHHMEQVATRCHGLPAIAECTDGGCESRKWVADLQERHVVPWAAWAIETSGVP